MSALKMPHFRRTANCKKKLNQQVNMTFNSNNELNKLF